MKDPTKTLKIASPLFLSLALLFSTLPAKELTIPLVGENEVIDAISHNLHVDSMGRIYLADRRSCQILVFDSSGKRLARIGGKGEGPGEFKRWFGCFALSVDDRVLQIDFWGGNRSISCFSPSGQLNWVHKIQKDGDFGPESIYPTRDGRLILGIESNQKPKQKGELLYNGSTTTFYLADEGGKLYMPLSSVETYADFSDQSGHGWPRIPFQVELISAFDAVKNRLAYQKTNEDKVYILDIQSGKTIDAANGFVAKPLTPEQVVAEARLMMTVRGRESFQPLYKKLISAGATIESHLPIVTDMVFTDSGELLIGSKKEGENNFTIFTLDANQKLTGPQIRDRFPAVVAKGLAYYLLHDEEEDYDFIRVEPWVKND